MLFKKNASAFLTKMWASGKVQQAKYCMYQIFPVITIHLPDSVSDTSVLQVSETDYINVIVINVCVYMITQSPLST